MMTQVQYSEYCKRNSITFAPIEQNGLNKMNFGQNGLNKMNFGQHSITSLILNSFGQNFKISPK
jgi:hypothetical protein